MGLRCLVIALTFLAAFVSDSWGESKRVSQPQAQPTQQQTAPDQRGTQNQPVIVKILPTPDAEAKAEKDSAEQEEKRKLDRDTLLLSKLTVGIIFLQLLIFGVQAYYLRGTLVATATAATAAESAAKTADKSIELSESASITVDMWSVENWGTPQPTVKFHIYNSGKNTAEILELVCRAPVALELPETPNYTDAPRSPVAIVAPGARNQGAIIPQLSPEQIAATEAGALTLFVYGKITFRSVNFNTVWELGFAQRLAFTAPNAQGVRTPEFYYPINPGFNFLRPKT
jgi:hypothetical protein